MGYFNFYFLKKLLQNKKFKKFLIFIIFFIVLLILKNNVFAIEVDYNNTHYSLPDFPSSYDKTYKIIEYRARTSSFYYRCWDNPYDFTLTSGDTLSAVSYDYYNNPVYWNEYRPSTQTWQYSGNWGLFSNGSNVIYYPNLVWSNFTVTYKDGNGNDVVVYEPPESYENLPHFLNDSDSIAVGGQSLVIMPRRFS